MSKKLLVLLCGAVFACLTAFQANAQSRKRVTAAEATGTFRHYFTGEFKGSYEEIKILALGKNRLKVSFELLYPKLDAAGQPTANMGTGGGEASIVGDTAVFSSNEFGPCKITIKFDKPGTIRVSQQGTDAECGFGFNVTANGTYRKVSHARPKFTE